ncbi:hypothetical protein PIB30_091591 [Stylosanthes scabra]|uniref:Putative plant transposon protein domain-containing protein n=1 Tax=Stylosanthes scabra TaxID=79078 RepID=A0ABU6QU00_9FABA|nr:hypothetical protein [Stylosanthes scabra]
MFEEFARNKDIISEKGFELGDEEYPEVQHQITLRGWKRLTSPRTKVKVLMIKEFFANAARTQEELDEKEQHPLTSFVRGVEVDFSPANIKRVMKFKDNTPGAETDYNTRLYANQMLEEVLRDLCIPGATWKLGTGQPPQPIQLRRKELQPLARGWLELIIHNIHPSSNRSEVIVARAILIHSILKESSITAKVMETVRGGAAPIIRRHQEEEGDHNEGQGQEGEADHNEGQGQDQEMYDAEDVYEPHHHQSYVEHETGAESWMNHEAYYEQQQQNYYEPHQSPHQQPPQQQQGLKAITDLVTNTQIDTLNYYEKIKTYQEYQYDQMKAIIAQQQEVIDTQNREFQVMKSKQDQLEKELSEIRKAQVNLAMYKSNSSSQAMDGSNEELQRLRKIIEDQRLALVQQSRAAVGSSQIAPIEEKLDKIASSVARFNEELATFKERHEQLANLSYKQYTLIRKEQESTSQEVKEIKERQINPVDNETLKDVAKMTFQQREELKLIRKQMREWTMYSSARECYDVWAHQQANPNLVQMPLHDLTKMVYDNLENKRPMFSGALKSDSNAGQVSRPEPIPPEDLHLYNNQQVSFFEK